MAALPDMLKPGSPDMPQSYCPRVSEAMHRLPELRSHIVQAAPHFPLPIDLSIDLLPIVEDGIFGYELVPDREARMCLTLGFNEAGVPVLRKTAYGTVVPSALRLAMINGRPVPARESSATRQSDDLFADLTSACEATWAHLSDLFPSRPRRPVRIDETLHRVLDEALTIAHTHLVPWDPYIEFCGIPNEAQQGFALRGENHSSGELISTRPDMWVLRWKTPTHAVYEEWSVVVPGKDASEEITRA